MPEVLSHFGILAGIFAYKYSELGINDKTLNDWVIKYGRTG